MNIPYIKNKVIKKMRLSGLLAGKVLRHIKSHILPGITTAELNDICHNYIIKKKAIPGCLGYHGFPYSTCISVNEEACHGIPSKKKILNTGDIVNIDVTVIKNKYYADTSKTFIVGKTNTLAYQLCQAAKKSLYITFSKIKPGVPINIIGETIQNYIDTTPFSIVEEYCGHGIGRYFHEKPYILHYHYHEKKIFFKQGMIFTIEPIINAGNKEVFCMNDNWTVCTKDRSLSAQYEHTVLVTKNGCEILTKRKNEKIKRIYCN